MTELEHDDPRGLDPGIPSTGQEMRALELELQRELDEQIDAILRLLARAGEAGVELDPLRSIIGRLNEQGFDLEGMPPMVRMVLDGMLG